MKTSKVIIIIGTIFIFTSCSLLWTVTVPTFSDIKPAGKNKYSIKVLEGTGLNIYSRWDEDAKKQCGSKKMVTTSQQYINNSKGVNYLEGTFVCK